MSIKKQIEHSKRTMDTSPQPFDPVTSLTALTPPLRDPSSGGDAPMPSDEGYARQFFRVWTRRLMLLCALGAVLLSAAVPLLSLLRVSEITLEGEQHYLSDTLLATAAVSVGDELLALSPSEIEQTLLKSHPYLATAKVSRSLSGRVHIHVTERKARWALYLSEEGVALLDESMQVLELTLSEGDLCLVKWELFVSSDEDTKEQENSEQKEQIVTPGMPYRGNPEAIEKLAAIYGAMQSLGFDEVPELVDMSDRFAVTLHLTDGTAIALHECHAPTEQIRAALGALQAYRQQYGESGPMLVDVDDFSRVSLRPIPKSGQ